MQPLQLRVPLAGVQHGRLVLLVGRVLGYCRGRTEAARAPLKRAETTLEKKCPTAPRLRGSSSLDCGVDSKVAWRRADIRLSLFSYSNQRPYIKTHLLKDMFYHRATHTTLAWGVYAKA